METKDQLEFRFEVARKAIHLSSLSIAIIYYHISRESALLLLVPLFSGFFLVDMLKNYSSRISAWYHQTFGSILREHELPGDKKHLNGATFVALAALLLVLFFPKLIAVAAFSMVAVSDTVAGLVGKSFGKHRFGHKSLEGSAGFFVSALIIIMIIPGLHPVIGLVMAITATLTEAFLVRIGRFRVDDNLSIPLVSASAGMLSALLFMPEQLRLLSICP